MRILYDMAASQPNGETKFHGGSEYSKTVFYELVNRNSGIEVEAFYDKNRETDEQVTLFCKEKNIALHYIDLSQDLNRLINDRNYDVVYSALPGKEYLNVKFPLETKFVFTQHGLRGLELLNDKFEIKYIKGIKRKIKCIIRKIFPEIVLKRRLEAVKELFDVTENKQLITDSFHSKSSILRYFPELSEDQITVAAAPAKKVITDNNEKEVLNNIGVVIRKYFLLVSADRWEKNNYRMIIALNQLIKSKKDLFRDYKILVLGNEGGTIYKNIILEENREKFIFRGYVSVEELEALYKNAFAFLYPSLNEGFGYPPIEAMKYGTLSICAADSSITEVCGDAVLYFNPYNTNEMAIRVLQSFDNEVREQLNGKMHQHYQEISEIQEEAMSVVLNAICG